MVLFIVEEGIGLHGWVRTTDILLPKQTHYQAVLRRGVINLCQQLKKSKEFDA
jgi:hypothetical protein